MGFKIKATTTTLATTTSTAAITTVTLNNVASISSSTGRKVIQGVTNEKDKRVHLRNYVLIK